MSERIDLESPAANAEPEIARVYEWNGKALLPFSAGRHMALERLKTIGGSRLETACSVVRLCQMEPAEVSQVRDEGCQEFQDALAEWMDKEGIGLGAKRQEKTDAIIRLFNEMMDDLYEAKSLVPEATGRPAPGNG